MIINKKSFVGNVYKFLDYEVEMKSSEFSVSIFAKFMIEKNTGKVYEKDLYLVVLNRTTRECDHVVVTTLRDAFALCKVLGVMV